MVDRRPERTALAQLRAKGYADKYRELGRPVHLIGVESSREKRNITELTAEPA